MNRALHAALVAEPWLRPYVKDDDDTIEAARRRFEVDQKALLRRMLAEGVELHERVVMPDGMLTTSLELKEHQR